MKREKVAGKNNPMYGKKHTPEALAKMRGRKFTSEQILKLSESRKGFKVSDATKLKISNSTKGRAKTQEVKDKIRKTLMGSEISAERRAKISAGTRGLKHSVEERKRKSDSQLGSKSHLWRGGITPINQKIRHSLEYKLWREAVFARDNYKCVWCGDYSRKGNPVTLNADHIKPFAYYPELRFAIDNGRTLCVPCHKTTDTYGGRSIKKMSL